MPSSSQRLIGAVLIAAGVAFALAGLVLGSSVDPIWASLVAVGLSDIVFGALFMTGRFGTPVGSEEAEGDDRPRPAPSRGGGSAEPLEREVSPHEPDPRAGTDPDYNPYVRDD